MSRGLAATRPTSVYTLVTFLGSPKHKHVLASVTSLSALFDQPTLDWKDLSKSADVKLGVYHGIWGSTLNYSNESEELD